MIFKNFVLGPVNCNCYVVADENKKEGFIVDIGGRGDFVFSKIEKMGISIKYIFCTHGHFDHVAGISAFKKLLNIPVCLNKKDLPLYENVKEQTDMFGFEDVEQPPTPPEIFYSDDDEFLVGDIKCKILETPGHTKGGVSIYLPDNKILFSGDTLFESSVGRTDLPGSSHFDIINSIKNKLLVLPDDISVFPGHGRPTKIGDEKIYNPYL